MKKHICIERYWCSCSVMALEPDDDCPIHAGGGIPRCCYCGKFLKRNTTRSTVHIISENENENSSNK